MVVDPYIFQLIPSTETAVEKRLVFRRDYEKPLCRCSTSFFFLFFFTGERNSLAPMFAENSWGSKFSRVLLRTGFNYWPTEVARARNLALVLCATFRARAEKSVWSTLNAAAVPLLPPQPFPPPRSQIDARLGRKKSPSLCTRAKDTFARAEGTRRHMLQSTKGETLLERGCLWILDVGQAWLSAADDRRGDWRPTATTNGCERTGEATTAGTGTRIGSSHRQKR